MIKQIAFVVPVFNEQYNVVPMYEAICRAMQPLNYHFSITFINDGSTDETGNVLKQLSTKYSNLFYINFSTNFGHQNALKAGFDKVSGDCIITLDGDLQHPPELIPEMIAEWEKGADIVYTIREDMASASYMKRKTSTLFYKVLNKLSDINIESGTADFRLTDKKVADILKSFNESELFWRGLVKWLGFTQTSIAYVAGERKNGNSKYTFKKMFQLAVKGITSFSTKPLNMAIYIGFTMAALAVLYVPYVIYSFWIGKAINGWSSIIVTIAFFGGLQLIILGIIGLYLGKLFMQSKQRPHYIIKETNL